MVDVNIRSKQLTGITQDTKITLYASYKGYSDSKELEFKFVPRIYFGPHVSDNLTSVTELNSHLGEISGGSFDCSGGKYAYVAVPTEFKNRIKFIVSSLEVDSYTTSNISVINSNNKTVEYTLFKLDNKQFGQFNMDIKIN